MLPWWWGQVFKLHLSAESLPDFKNHLWTSKSTHSPDMLFRLQYISQYFHCFSLSQKKRSNLRCTYVILHAPAALWQLCQVEHGTECCGSILEGLIHCVLDRTSFARHFGEKRLPIEQM